MRTVSTTPKKLNRWVRLGIATVTSTALVGGVVVAAPAHPLLPAAQVAQAQEQNAEAIAEAEAQLLDLVLLQQYVEPGSEDAFLEVLEAFRAEAQFPGGVEDEADIDLTLLEGIDLEIGGLDISLLELLGIEGNLGALGAYASTPAGNDSYAAAGLLTDGGSINLGAHDGTTGVQTVLDLTTLLEGQGVDAITDGIVDELALRLGAVSASADYNGEEVTSEYALANVGLTLDSPLVGDLVTALTGGAGDFDDPDQVGLVGEVDRLVNGLEGDPSLLNSVDGLLGGVFDLLRTLSFGLVDIETTLDLETNLQGVVDGLLGGVIESESGLVAIDLTTGQVQINLDELGSLSAADPNTNLLNEQAVQEISADLDTLLDGLLDNIREAIEEGLLETSVTVGIDASALFLPLADITLDGSLNQFLAADPDVINVDLLGANLPTLEGLLLGVLGTLGTTLETAIDGVVDPLLDEVLGELGLLDEVVAPLVGGVSDLLSDSNVLSLTLNHQPNSQVVSQIARDVPGRPNAATAPITNADQPFTVSGLRVNVLAGLVDLPLARVTVDADADWEDDSDSDALSILPILDQEGPVGIAIDPIDVEVSDPEAEVDVEGLPDGLTYNSETDSIEGTPAEGTEGPHYVVVTASKDEDEVAEEFTFVVIDGDDNGEDEIAAPVIESIDDQRINLGDPITPVNVDVTGEDVDVEVTGLPTGVTFDPATLEISGTPTAAGNSTVIVTATNSGGEVAEAFVITVVEGDDGNGDGDIDGPEIAPIDNQDGVVGEPIESIDVDVTGEDVTVVVEGLPDGLNYNEETSVIEGTPGEHTEGNHTVTVNASNEGGDDSTAFIITITDEDGGDAPGGDNGSGPGPGGSLPGSSEGDNGSGDLFPGGSSDLFPGSSNGENGNGNGDNSSSEQLQQCLANPETGLAALLAVLGVTAAVSGPVVDPIVRAVGEQFSAQVRQLTGSTPENDPEWLNQINAGLAEASQALDSRIVATALFGAGALALIFADDLCGSGNEGLSSQLSS